MAGIAAIAREAGHHVTGSDRGVYPPMSDQLRALGIAVTEGYDAGQLDPRPDIVVVGNVMSRGVPVVEELLNRRIPYASGPEWLAREILRDRWVLAVSGTHGKTTTTGMLAWILDQADLKPGFLIGGVARDFDRSARLGGGEYFVIEADEYDTAFFDKNAKFLHYRPRTLVVNNLEFDHADIYPDLAAIQEQFHRLIRMVPGNGQIIARADDSSITEVIDRGCWTPVMHFSGEPGSGEWRASSVLGQLTVSGPAGLVGRTRWFLAGSYNAENALGALLAARHVGIEPAASLSALARFRGVKRRLELLGTFGGVRVFDDFAHHPTAIVRTIAAVRSEHPAGRILVLMEPRSNTMKLGVHREALAGALAGADAGWVLLPPGLQWDLAGALAAAPAIRVRPDTDSIIAEVMADIRDGDTIVIMSNGDFANLRSDLPRALGHARGGAGQP